MSNQYAGGFISKTPPTVTTSSAQGMWTLSQQAQYQKAGVWPVYVPPPTTIGQAYGGGYYAGKIAVGGGGVATHYLIVAPKASGENSSREWGEYGVTTGFTSDINGPTNSAGEAALGYQAAVFCEGLTIGGYTDWYLPAKNELEVLYYFLKPNAIPNATYGANANAVSPEPINTDYTSGSPAQTSSIAFQSGNSEAFNSAANYWASTENTMYRAVWQSFYDGSQLNNFKYTSAAVRAVRRIPV